MEANLQSGGPKGPLADPKVEERRAPDPSQKDTRRWCRGKVGEKHERVWIFWFDIPAWRGEVAVDWQKLVCVNCGRQFNCRTVRSDRPSHQPGVDPTVARRW